jgi:hypothetical protein
VQKLAESIDELINAFYGQTRGFITGSEQEVEYVKKYVKQQGSLVTNAFLMLEASISTQQYISKIVRCQKDIEKAADERLRQLVKQQVTTDKIAQSIQNTSKIPETKAEKSGVKKLEDVRVYSGSFVAELAHLNVRAKEVKVDETTKLQPKKPSYGSIP